jgi:hypothetical protein
MTDADRRTMTDAMWQADSLLQDACREVSRSVSGERATRVLNQIGWASFHLEEARAAATRARSIPALGQSLAGVDGHLGGAWSAVRAAVQAVGLRIDNLAELLRSALRNISVRNSSAAAQNLQAAMSFISDLSLRRMIDAAIIDVNRGNWAMSRELTETVLRDISSRPSVRR